MDETARIFNKVDSLNWKVRLSVDPRTKFSELSRKFNIKSEVGILIEGDSSETTLSFPNNAEQHRDIWIFLKEFDAVEQGGIWKVRSTGMESDPIAELINAMRSVPSAVLTSLWLSEGRYSIELIFHRNDTGKVSDILLERWMNNENSRIEYLGPSQGFAAILSEINSRTPTSVVEIELRPPLNEMGSEMNPVGDSWVRIARLPHGSHNVEGIYFTEERPHIMDKINEIDSRKIYSATTSNPYLNFMNEEMNSRKILSLGMLHDFNRPVFRTYTIVPTIFAMEFLSVVKESRERMSEWKPALRRLISVTEWLKG